MHGRHLRQGFALAIGLVLLAAVPAQAAPAQPVTIVVNAFSSGETFEAEGLGSCTSGDAITFGFKFAGGPRAGTFHLFKELACADGSGTITIRVEASVVFGAPTDEGGWNVAGATGDYAGLKGGGSLVGTYVDEGVIDHYTGMLRS